MPTLVHHWDLHEGSGNTIEDIVSGNDGTFRPDDAGNLPQWVEGPVAGMNAIQFLGRASSSGTCQAVCTIGAMSCDISHPFGFDCYVKLGPGREGGIYGVLQDSWDDPLVPYKYEQFNTGFYVGTDNNLYLAIGYSRVNTYYKTSLFIAPKSELVGEWHHLTGYFATDVLAGEALLWEAWLDLEVVASFAPGGQYENIVGTTPLRMGGLQDWYGYQEFYKQGSPGTFDGAIANMRIWCGYITPDDLFPPEPPLQNISSIMFSCNT
jgi:hypothetical protein